MCPFARMARTVVYLTAPVPLCQVWSSAEWGPFIEGANAVVKRHLRGVYKWRGVVAIVPFPLVMVVALFVLPAILYGFDLSSFLYFCLFMAVGIGCMVGFEVAYRRKLATTLSDLTALCHATNQSTQPGGLTWSVKQSASQTRCICWHSLSRIVSLQGDVAMAAQPMPPPAAAAGVSIAVRLPTYDAVLSAERMDKPLLLISAPELDQAV